MNPKKLNPAAPGRALAGSGDWISSAAIDFHPNTTALALQQILRRVAISPSVALVLAEHAGILREARA